MCNTLSKENFSIKHSFPIGNKTRTSKLLEIEVKEIMKKWVIRQFNRVKRGSLSSLFIAKRKDWMKRPVINLKHLNPLIPYNHFKLG